MPHEAILTPEKLKISVVGEIILRPVIVFLTLLGGWGWTAPAFPAQDITDFRLPKFRMGIWATNHYREANGRPPGDVRESVTGQCFDPAETIRQGLISGRRTGCEIKVESQKNRDITYSSTCPSGSLRLEVQTRSATEYTITTTSQFGRDVQTGRWVRDCPSVAELPMPTIKKGIWSIATQPDLLSKEKTERTAALCGNSAAIMIDELVKAKDEGCDIRSWNKQGNGWSYGGDCRGVRDNFSLVIGMPSAEELQIMVIAGSRMKTITGQWLGDCPASNKSRDPKSQH